ncbi:MAG: hypothetical protein M3Y58_09170 [Chloroflexota bacterium]|nr:hypothetical protein [Chloroflexota bacterium]
MSVTPKPPAFRDADVLAVARFLEAERQRLGDERMLAMLNADGFLPRHATKRQRPRLVEATRGADRVIAVKPLMEATYAPLRQQIRLVGSDEQHAPTMAALLARKRPLAGVEREGR